MSRRGWELEVWSVAVSDGASSPSSALFLSSPASPLIKTLHFCCDATGLIKGEAKSFAHAIVGMKSKTFRRDDYFKVVENTSHPFFSFVSKIFSSLSVPNHLFSNQSHWFPLCNHTLTIPLSSLPSFLPYFPPHFLLP